MRRVLLLVTVIVALAACGDDAGPLFGDAASSTSVTSSSGGTAGTAAPTTTTTTAAVAPDPIQILAEETFEPVAGPPPSEVGTPDLAAADAIATDLFGDGGLPTGLDLLVLPVVGTTDRLLVLTVEPAAEDSEDDTGDLLELIAASQAVADAGITHFVAHYYDTDADGAFVLTMAMPFDVLLQAGTATSDELRDLVAIEVQRLETP